MKYTPQETALGKVQALYGVYGDRSREYGFTEDHEHYRKVGCYKNGHKYTAVGETWDEAITALRAKVEA